MFPDYGAEVARVAGWVAIGAGLTNGKTLFVEPTLPKSPDRVVLVFESGGVPNEARGLQDWYLPVVARAPQQAEARRLTAAVLTAAVKGFQEAAVSERGTISHLKLNGLPALKPRDERGRVIIEAGLVMTLYAPTEFGVAVGG